MGRILIFQFLFYFKLPIGSHFQSKVVPETRKTCRVAYSQENGFSHFWRCLPLVASFLPCLSLSPRASGSLISISNLTGFSLNITSSSLQWFPDSAGERKEKSESKSVIKLRSRGLPWFSRTIVRSSCCLLCWSIHDSIPVVFKSQLSNC